MSRFGRSVAMVLLLLLVLAPQGGECKWWFSAEDPRISRAQEERDSARAMLARMTNESEKVLWQQRVVLAEKELENAKRFAELDKREKALASKRRGSADFALRESLSAVDTATSDAERDARSLGGKLRSQRSRRAELVRAAEEDKQEETDEASKIRAERESQIRNIDTAIQSCMSQREAAELHIRLAREAERIEEARRTMELNPKPTIRLILQNMRAVADTRNKVGEFEETGKVAQQQMEQTRASAEIARERFSHLDEEIGILRDTYKVAKKSKASPEQAAVIRDLRRLLDMAESEKNLMEDRLAAIEDQSAALDRSISLCGRGAALMNAEIAFLKDYRSRLQALYLQRVVTPLFVIALLVALWLLFDRTVLPRFYRKDSLFIAKRMSSYGLFLLIVVVLVIFFLEDLRAIATVLGIATAAVVIALQDLCSSFAGWFVIVASGKLKVGDRIEIDGKVGDVIDMQILRTTLAEVNNWLGADEPTGRIILLPNSFIFKSNVFNYSHVHKYIWDKIDITVTYESSVRKAHDLLATALKEETESEFRAATEGEERLEKKYGAKRGVYEPRIDTIIADSGVLFRMIYATHYERRCVTQNRLMRRILAEFAGEPDVDFAYPTRRHVQSRMEPKEVAPPDKSA